VLNVRASSRGIGRRTRAVLDAGAQPVRTLRRVFDRDLRRAERWTYRRFVRTGVVAGIVVVVAVAVALATGWWFVAVIALALFGIDAMVLGWRARRGRGRAARWPTGDLRPGPEALTRVDHFARRARRYGPVFKTSFLDTPMCCIADLGIARRLLREHAEELAPPWGPYERFVPGGSIRGADAATNAELRRLYSQTLTAGLVRSWQPVFSRRVAWTLAALVAASDAPDGINPRPAVRTLVLEAWCDVMLGIPPESRAFVEASALVSDLDPDRRFYAEGLPDEVVEAKLDRLAELVVRAAATRDRTAVPTTLADGFARATPAALADPAVMRNLLYTVITTRDDVAGLLLWVLWYLGAHPQSTARVRAEPDDAPALADRVVSETLRLAQSEFVMRKTRADIRFGDVVIPKDWYVRACIREIHRDDSNFARADQFEPDRFLDGELGRDRYAPFGIDHRSCLGELLTRTIARTFVLEVAASVDVTTVDDGPVELSPQRHWSPSSRWRVRVHARSDLPTSR